MVVKRLVKGVHQNIIEITDTGIEQFDRVILFLRPGQDQGDDLLCGHAHSYLQKLKFRRGILHRRKLGLTILKLVSAAAFGAVVAALFLTL